MLRRTKCVLALKLHFNHFTEVLSASVVDAKDFGGSYSESSGSKSDDSDSPSFECHEDLEFQMLSSGVDRRAEMEGSKDFRNVLDRDSPVFNFLTHHSTFSVETELAARCVSRTILYPFLAASPLQMPSNVSAICLPSEFPLWPSNLQLQQP